MTQSDPFCTSIITPSQITRAYYNDTIIKNRYFLKEEHILAYVSSMMISELQRHCNHFSFKKMFFYVTCSHSFLYSLVMNVHTLTPCIPTHFYFYGTCHKHKITKQPPPLNQLSYTLRKSIPSLHSPT